jgi:hypothetical protein
MIALSCSSIVLVIMGNLTVLVAAGLKDEER